MTRDRRRLYPLVFLAAGTLFALLAAGLAAHSLVWLVQGQSAVGTVLEVRGDRPRVGYSVGGQAYTLTPALKASWNHWLFAAGEAVPVRYDPADPTVAVLATPGNLWLFPAVVAAFGAVFTYVGWADIRHRRALVTPRHQLEG